MSRNTANTHHYSSEEIAHLEETYGAHNYHPLPVCFARASGVHVWDPEGKRYYDFLSAYSAVNQGHCHPKIIEALCNQAHNLTLSSRAFFNNRLGPYEKFVTEFFGFEMVLPMNTGVEGVETALKLARRWGYVKKQIPDNEGILICCEGNFHGRTFGAISMSNDPSSFDKFGPFLPGLIRIPYNDSAALGRVLEEHGPRVAGFIVEPIQGEAGVFVPDDGYLERCRDLCTRHNVLLICDEVQTGIGRTGKLCCYEWDNIKPDILILGKALGGGVIPVSAVLSSREIMLTINPGEHGSTFGGNPLACAVAVASLEVIRDEHLTEKAYMLGESFRNEIRALNCPLITQVRGRGLLNAIVIRDDSPATAWQICCRMKKNGLLAKPTHDTIIRLAPPLVITREQIAECVQIIKTTLEEVQTLPVEELGPAH